MNSTFKLDSFSYVERDVMAHININPLNYKEEHNANSHYHKNPTKCRKTMVYFLAKLQE